MVGSLQPSPEPSPDDLSSPNPDQAAPLLQAQQRPPSRAERGEARPGSASGTGIMDVEITETRAVKEGVDIQSSLTGTDREQSEQGRTAEKDSEQGRIEGKDCEDKETVDRETADEGLPPSKGSEIESEEESEGQKEHSDANNNSLEIPEDRRDDFVAIPEPPAQVGLTDVSKPRVSGFTSMHRDRSCLQKKGSPHNNEQECVSPRSLMMFSVTCGTLPSVCLSGRAVGGNVLL